MPTTTLTNTASSPQIQHKEVFSPSLVTEISCARMKCQPAITRRHPHRISKIWRGVMFGSTLKLSDLQNRPRSGKECGKCITSALYFEHGVLPNEPERIPNGWEPFGAHFGRFLRFCLSPIWVIQ